MVGVSPVATPGFYGMVARMADMFAFAIAMAAKGIVVTWIAEKRRKSLIEQAERAARAKQANGTTLPVKGLGSGARPLRPVKGRRLK